MEAEGHWKTPYYFSSESEPIVSFAGLIRPLSRGGQVVIITTEATPPHAEIHDRMHVMLSRSGEGECLLNGNISMNHESLGRYVVFSGEFCG